MGKCASYSRSEHLLQDLKRFVNAAGAMQRSLQHYPLPGLGDAPLTPAELGFVIFFGIVGTRVFEGLWARGSASKFEILGSSSSSESSAAVKAKYSLSSKSSSISDIWNSLCWRNGDSEYIFTLDCIHRLAKFSS